MPSLGLRFHVVAGKRRVLRAVILADDGSSIVTAVEHILDPSVSQAQQARDARDWLRSALAAQPDVAAAILFEADRGPRAMDTDAVRHRLRIEGAALTAALDHVSLVEVRNGKRLGDLIGGSKEAAMTLGSAVSGSQPAYAEAAAAAAAALKLT